MRPRVFIGSSSEGFRIAEALQNYLEDEGNYRTVGGMQMLPPEVRSWKSNCIFEVGESLTRSLFEATEEYDFAVMVFSDDDFIVARETELRGPRDNVIFEAGLFAGSLGFDRLYVVVPQRTKVKIPSDLTGFNRTSYLLRDDGSINASVAGQAIIQAIRNHGVVRHQSIDPKIRALVSRARSAYRIDHAMFHDYLASWCDQSLKESDSWPAGSMIVEKDTARWLLMLYRQAKRNIFSTSIPLYTKIWCLPVGKELLQAQVDAGCPSTRIFVFPNRASVSDKDLGVMHEHKTAGINVRAFYDEEVAELTWSPGDINSDFTFIDDGEVIGVTEETQKNYRARWFFMNESKKIEYEKHKRSLLMFSEEVGAE
jgi:predicted nucleotide-binding protein